jgi:carbon storage regulator
MAAMLVLTRKSSELIQIGESIVVKVIHTGKNTVKIGIEAPHEVRILRGELCETPADHPLAAFLSERPIVRTRHQAATNVVRPASPMPRAR